MDYYITFIALLFHNIIRNYFFGENLYKTVKTRPICIYEVDGFKIVKKPKFFEYG